MDFPDDDWPDMELFQNFVDRDEAVDITIHDFDNQVGGNDVDLPYVLRERSRRLNRRFQATEIIYEARSNAGQISEADVGNTIGTAIEFLRLLVIALLAAATADLEGDDLIRFCFYSDYLDRPISTRLTRVSDLTVDFILNTIMKVLQSNDTIPIDDPSFRIDVITVRNPVGGGGVKRKVVNIHVDRLRKQSIITMPTTCAIVVGKAYMDSHPQLKTIRDSRKPLQRILAQELHQDASVVYKGPERPTKLFLYCHDHHYDLIRSMKGFHSTNHYCETCDVAYNNVQRHHCNVRCNVCFANDCPSGTPQVCSDCHRTCRSVDCFDRHKSIGTKNSSYCQQFYNCPSCHKFLETKFRPAHLHQCGEFFCKFCKKFFVEKHLCFLQPLTPKTPSDNYLFFLL